MSVFDIVGATENHPVYQELEASNRDRQYSFLESVVQTALALGRPFLTYDIVRALNYHAIAYLHVAPGQFRQKEVAVFNNGRAEYVPPKAFEVEAEMGKFMSVVQEKWRAADAIALGAYVLWAINVIHPFENGNGRTARAACYFVICTKLGSWLGGQPILPELLRVSRQRYVSALRAADAGEFLELISLINELLSDQIGESQK